MLDELLAHPSVEEVCELRGTFGFMAFHGGGLEEATDIIAQHAAEATGSSYYGIHQPASLKWHVPSHRIDPQHSETLSGFIDHVDTVITQDNTWIILLTAFATMECRLNYLHECAEQVHCGGIGKVHISLHILNRLLMASYAQCIRGMHQRVLRSQTLNKPGSICLQCIAKAVVQATRSTLPKLNFAWSQHPATPMWRSLNIAPRKPLFCFGQSAD